MLTAGKVEEELKGVQAEVAMHPFFLDTPAIRPRRGVSEEVLRGLLAARLIWRWVTDLCSFRKLAISVVFLSVPRIRFGFQKESTGRSPNPGSAL